MTRSQPVPPRRVGIIGLGKMGSPMAARLLAAGHAVVGFDVDRAATERLAADGGQAAESPADAARAAEVLL
ncbi:MAG: NAD(P)-binding domain-containing protein, partial [Gammaproteobacteria bacterium]|nr:NAD(P)-binding domain-containing protein [Gammaproteobacteria bacterium]